jgi:hypothetical protein
MQHTRRTNLVACSCRAVVVHELHEGSDMHGCAPLDTPSQRSGGSHNNETKLLGAEMHNKSNVFLALVRNHNHNKQLQHATCIMVYNDQHACKHARTIPITSRCTAFRRQNSQQPMLQSTQTVLSKYHCSTRSKPCSRMRWWRVGEPEKASYVCSSVKAEVRSRHT